MYKLILLIESFKRPHYYQRTFGTNVETNLLSNLVGLVRVREREKKKGTSLKVKCVYAPKDETKLFFALKKLHVYNIKMMYCYEEVQNFNYVENNTTTK